jgi:hypothetical protein
MIFRRSLLGVALLVAGCGESITPDGGANDASATDGGMVRRDAGQRDAGMQTEDDAGMPDAGREPCDSPGTLETVPCGMCGTVDRFCSSEGFWSYAACDGERECAAGTTRTGPCGNCGRQRERCSDACVWEPDGTCTDQGDCAPGTMSRNSEGCSPGETREVTCNDACTYEPTSACVPDSCSPRGMIELVECGMCGVQERFCTAEDVWQYEDCASEGVCAPGTVSTMPCGMCGEQSVRCLADCTWMEMGECLGQGECAPGAERRTSMGCAPGETRLVRCDAGCDYTIEVSGCEATAPIDVLFLVDATASNWTYFQDQLAAFTASCVDPLLAIPDVAVGIAYYGDFGTTPETFVAGVELDLATSADIALSIQNTLSFGGGDDSTMEALYIVTGGTPQAGAIPFTCSSGRVAGGCWRAGADRVIAMHTNEFAKGGPDPNGTGVYSAWPTGPDWTTVLPRLMSDGSSLFVLYDDDGFDAIAVPQYEEMVSDLGQPTSDVILEDDVEPGIDTACDALVARVRALAGL